MEQKKANRVGTKNKTWCGVPIDLYRRRKAELSKEDFRAWWFKKTGRPLCIRYSNKANPSDVAHEMLSSALKRMSDIEKTLSTVIQQRDAALKSVEHYRQMLVEKKSWIQRLFSSKE